MEDRKIKLDVAWRFVAHWSTCAVLIILHNGWLYEAMPISELDLWSIDSMERMYRSQAFAFSYISSAYGVTSHRLGTYV